MKKYLHYIYLFVLSTFQILSLWHLEFFEFDFCCHIPLVNAHSTISFTGIRVL